MHKIRLDVLVVNHGLAESRQKAARLILSGKVSVDGAIRDKCGSLVPEKAAVKILEDNKYVSRGGIKLEAALASFNIHLEGKIALDAGASTGGFTDCLLRHHISAVYAIDVGYGQLAWKLRNDPRVKVIERTNIRIMEPSQLETKVDIAVLDLSFISLTLVLPNVYKLLADKGEVIALIKPQFEVGKGEVGKGGIVRDPEKQKKVIQKISTAAEGMGFENFGVIESPVTGAKGNKEYFIYLKKNRGLVS